MRGAFSFSTRALRASAALMAAIGLTATHAAEPENVAYGKPYALDPGPNYGGATSRTGAAVLTDGVTSKPGAIWTQPTTVGWMRARPVVVSIDLGASVVIDRVTWHGAAGAADVEWPAAIFMFASVDGIHFTPLGDLVALDAARGRLPPAGRYAEYTFDAIVPATQARFLRLMGDPRGPYLFVDEIQVFRAADPARADTPYTISDTTEEFWSGRGAAKTADAARNDFARIRARMSTLKLSSDQRRQFDAQAAGATTSAVEAARAMRSPGPSFPFGSAHAALYAALGAAEHAAGLPALQAWAADPWAPLTPEERSQEAIAARVSIIAMRGEPHRSGALNIHNSTAHDASVVISESIDGISSQQLSFAPVAWTATDQSGWIAAKILPAATSVTVPAGTTQQIWVTLTSADAAPGLHTGVIRIRAEGLTTLDVPAQIRIFSTRFPDQQSLVVGGWDYLQDPGTNGITPANIDLVAPLLRSQGVTAPWATRAALELGRYDSTGRMVAPPSTIVLQHWLARWPAAVRYRVFVGASGDIGGIPIGDPRFPIAVREWAVFWANAVRRLGKTPQDFDIHFVDEPRNMAQAQIEVAWLRALRASGAGFRLWANPNWPIAADTPRELVDLADVICVNLSIAEAAGDKYWQWVRSVVGAGKSVELYGTDGPAKLRDPYGYYRSPAWRASDVGAVGVSFWSFSDSGGGESSSGYSVRSIDYVPFFLDRDAVAAGKHMEAIGEGARDFEYLRLLTVVATTAPNANVREAATAMLHQARNAVVASAAPFNGAWVMARDRAAADAWRLRIGSFLDDADPAQRR